jgi:hypothetical protein
MVTKHSNASEALRHHSAALVAYAKELTPNRCGCLSAGYACRDMAQQVVMTAATARVRSDVAPKARIIADGNNQASPPLRDPIRSRSMQSNKPS